MNQYALQLLNYPHHCQGIQMAVLKQGFAGLVDQILVGGVEEGGKPGIIGQLRVILLFSLFQNSHLIDFVFPVGCIT
jgi:hypothetical protein